VRAGAGRRGGADGAAVATGAGLSSATIASDSSTADADGSGLTSGASVKALVGAGSLLRVARYAPPAPAASL